MSEKPVIFISHSSIDKTICRILQHQIETVLGGKDKITVFNSSDPFAIPPGSDWFEEISKQLNRANILVVMVTSSAKQSIWVGFEIGYFWAKTRGKFIYPVTVPKAKLFGPIEKLQAKSLDDAEEIEIFLNHLSKDLGIGDPSKADSKIIIEEAIHNARYMISEVEIRSRIRDFLLTRYKSGTTIPFADVDAEMELPEGSAARFLIQVLNEREIINSVDSYSDGGDEFDVWFEN